MPGKHGSPLSRFAAKIEIAPNGCWLWTASLDREGYAKLGAGGRENGWVNGHRWAYEHFRGPVPDGLTLDHLCRTRRCVNPWCLEAVMCAENIRRGDGPSAKLGRRTRHECGRPFDELIKGARSCSVCRLASYRQYYRDVRDGRRVPPRRARP